MLGSVDLDNLGNGPALTYSSVITRGTFFFAEVMLHPLTAAVLTHQA